MRPATKRHPMTAADRKARATMLDAFDQMPTTGLRHVVAGVAVIHAGLLGHVTTGVSKDLIRVCRQSVAEWERTRKTAQ